jgi:hypothetical protein
MEKAKLLPLIAALYLLDKNERAAHIKEAAKENGVNEGELFKALKEAGYNPKAEKGTAAPKPEPPVDAENGAQTPPSAQDGKNTQNAETDATAPNVAQQGESEQPPENDAGKIAVTLRHKTEYPQYRRAGIVLKQSPGEFRVTAEQLAVLEKDKWVEITKGGNKK